MNSSQNPPWSAGRNQPPVKPQGLSTNLSGQAWLRLGKESSGRPEIEPEMPPEVDPEPSQPPSREATRTLPPPSSSQLLVDVRRLLDEVMVLLPVEMAIAQLLTWQQRQASLGEPLATYRQTLLDWQATLQTATDETRYERWQQIRWDLDNLTREVEGKRKLLHACFWQLLAPATLDLKIQHQRIARLRQSDDRAEAEAQLAAIATYREQLRDRPWHDRNPGIGELGIGDLDLPSPWVHGTLGLLLDLGKCQQTIDTLLARSRHQRQRSAGVSAVYLALLVGAIAWWHWQGGSPLAFGQVPAANPTLLFGVPVPLLLWGLLGSCAAAIHRASYDPPASLGETLQWLLLRPLQGFLLSCVLYLFLTVAMTSLTIVTDAPMSSLPPVNPAMLLLAFLAGASDRLAAALFRWLTRSPLSP